MTIYEVLVDARNYARQTNNRFNVLYLTAVIDNLSIKEASQPAALLGVVC